MTKTIWPTDLCLKADFEIDIFERPSSDTSKELLAEVRKLRNQLWELGQAVEAVVSVSLDHLDHLKNLANDYCQNPDEYSHLDIKN